MLLIDRESSVGAPNSVLVVNASPAICEPVVEYLAETGLGVQTTESIVEALELIQEMHCSVVILDQQALDNSDINVIRRIKELSPDAEIVLFADNMDMDSIKDAFRNHIFSFVNPMQEPAAFIQIVQQAMEKRRISIQNQDLVRQLQTEREKLQKMVMATEKILERQIASSPAFTGESSCMAKVRRFVATVAPLDNAVLLLGERGTGKDALAKMIHEWSGCDIHTFVKISCSSMNTNILEAELFGHETGFMPGGERRKPGRFEQAAGGTIYLDEIDQIAESTQAKLLQLISNRRFCRMGGREEIPVAARIICSARANSEEMQKALLPDLWGQLRTCSMELPSLRDRLEDIPALAQHFLQKLGAKYNRPNLLISSRAMAALMQHDWPGNLIEMESLIKRFVLSGREDSLYPDEKPSLAANQAFGSLPNMEGRLRDTEIQTILSVLGESRWNQRRAAKMLGISYSALRRRIAKYDLKSRPLARID